VAPRIMGLPALPLAAISEADAASSMAAEPAEAPSPVRGAADPDALDALSLSSVGSDCVLSPALSLASSSGGGSGGGGDGNGGGRDDGSIDVGDGGGGGDGASSAPVPQSGHPVPHEPCEERQRAQSGGAASDGPLQAAAAPATAAERLPPATSAGPLGGAEEAVSPCSGGHTVAADAAAAAQAADEAPELSPLASGVGSGDLGPMELLESPLVSDATGWLSSAKPRRLSYNAASTGGRSCGASSGAAVAARGGAEAAVAAAEVQQTPAVPLAPALGGGGGGAAAEASLTMMALRARFSRATGAGPTR
jgi:hypothetical protein